MRIIAGTAKGRCLASFKSPLLRPTSDRIREAIFNILASFKGSHSDFFPFQEVLDIFAGTGAMGIEALSRGALGSAFIEKNKEVVKVLKENLKACDLLSRAEIVPLEAIRGLTVLMREEKVFDLVFLDPPYNKSLVEQTMNVLSDKGFLAHNAVVVAEHSINEIPPEKIGMLCLEDRRRYGSTIVSIYTAANNNL